MRFLTLSSFWSRLAVLGFDTCLAGLAFLIGLWFAHGLDFKWVNDRQIAYMIWASFSYAVIASMTFVIWGQYRAIWRYTSLKDLMVILYCTAVTPVAFLLVQFALFRGEDTPRTAVPIAAFCMAGLLILPRLIARLSLENSTPKLSFGRGDKDQIPAIVVGVDPRAETFVREVMRDPAAIFQIRGFVAPDNKWTRHELHGVRVLGAIDELKAILTDLDREGEHVQRLILADDTLDQDRVRQILETAAEHGATLGRLPRLSDLGAANGDDRRFDVKPVALEDLLRRPQKVLDRSLQGELIAGRRILVTGAGGSIGSELVRQIASFGPAQLTLLETSEFNLYAIDHELSVSQPGVKRKTALCDVRDAAGVERWFAECKPEIVFHAAAFKHVPMIEEHPLQGIATNVIGTRNVAEACLRHNVTAMVMISTDKAVNPRNVMGATKRLAEAFCQALDLQSANSNSVATRFFTVRFGNVLGSTGSVVPLFQQQLAAGGPLTVTHPDITRYFMTIPESVQLILQAAGMGVRDGGDRGKIFVLDMGEPIKIADLARQMIRLSGKRPDIDVKIRFIGLRPGEKLFEELLHAREELVASSQKGLLLGTPRTTELPLLRRDLDAMAAMVERGDVAGALASLSHSVPEYSPAEHASAQSALMAAERTVNGDTTT